MLIGLEEEQAVLNDMLKVELGDIRRVLCVEVSLNLHVEVFECRISENLLNELLVKHHERVDVKDVLHDLYIIWFA